MMSWLERAGGVIGKFQASFLSRLMMLSDAPSTGCGLGGWAAGRRRGGRGARWADRRSRGRNMDGGSDRCPLCPGSKSAGKVRTGNPAPRIELGSP